MFSSTRRLECYALLVASERIRSFFFVLVKASKPDRNISYRIEIHTVEVQSNDVVGYYQLLETRSRLTLLVIFKLTFLFSGHCHILPNRSFIDRNGERLRLRARMLRDEVYTHPNHAFKFGSLCVSYKFWKYKGRWVYRLSSLVNNPQYSVFSITAKRNK